MDAGKPNDVPAGDSVDVIGTYIKDQQYRQAPWISDVDGPRAGKSGTQHGDGVRVWMNKTLVDALKANHTGLNGAPYPDPGSMAVKELYDAMGQQVGAVAAYRTTDAPTGAAWVYYCYGPTMRCLADKDGTQAAPIYGRGNVAPTTACAICHGNTIYTRPPGVDGGL